MQVAPSLINAERRGRVNLAVIHRARDGSDAAVDAIMSAKQQRLCEPHMLRLEAYRADLASRFGQVPHFDPDDGGAKAACLMLLETPGPARRPLRFVSRDNPTATARNIARFCDAARLTRRSTVLWNAVPWIIHEDGARNRAPRRHETKTGIALLPDMLALLPHLRVVVLAGRCAGQARAVIEAAAPHLAVLAMPHPSPVYVNTAPHIAASLVATLEEAAGLLGRAAL